MEDSMFEEEFKYFIQNQDELVKNYNGKILVLRGSSVDSVFSTHIDAYEYAKKKYGQGNFMLQTCEPGPEAYTVTLSSNIIQW
jgi:hypothetical protein